MIIQFITSDGVRIEYDDYNSAAKKSIIIFSGIGGPRVIWKPQIKVLIRAGYRVINIDSRNQGSSERTTTGTSMARHALDGYEIGLALKLKSPYLMGNSMGAATALAYVALFGDQHISGIIDVDQSPKMINDQHWHYGYKQLNWRNFNVEIHKPLGKTTFNGLPEATFKLVNHAKAQFPYNDKLNFPLLVDLALQDWRDVLKKLTNPLLLIAGENSPLFNIHYLNEVDQLSDQITVRIIKRSGHLVMAEQPEQFNSILLSFLKKLNDKGHE